MSSTTLCRLPYEVIRVIFELAASDSPRTTFTLLLVSRAAHNWLERQLYAKVLIKNQNEHELFERCMSARDDDEFIASAVQQLSTGPNSDLLFICTNLTHLTLAELNLTTSERDDLPSLYHLKNVNYLSLDMLNGDIDNLPPNITHLRFRDVIWSNVVWLVQFVEDCPFLSHIMLDCAFDDMDVVDEFADGLPELMDTLHECKHIVIVPRIRSDDLSEKALGDIEKSPKQYHPQLIIVGTGELVDIVNIRNTMQCPEPLLSQFEFWDEMEEFLAKPRGEKAPRSAPVPLSPFPYTTGAVGFLGRGNSKGNDISS